jgi:hypothetical protein
VLVILIRAIRDIKPLFFFGGIGSSIFACGLASGFFLAIHWFLTGRTSPYTTLINVSSILLIIGFLLIILALIADLIGRNRRILEDLLYYNKVQYYESISSRTKK